MGRRGYPPEFRRKVLDLVEAGRPIAEVAKALGISDQSISTWRGQDRIDRGLVPGLSSREGGAGGRPPSDRPAGDRAGGHAPCRRAAQGASAPFDGSRPSR
jgi:transposase-like protein